MGYNGINNVDCAFAENSHEALQIFITPQCNAKGLVGKIYWLRESNDTKHWLCDCSIQLVCMTIWITMALFRLSVWGLIMIALCCSSFIFSKCWCCPISNSYVGISTTCFSQYLTSESFVLNLITLMFIILSIKTFRCSYFLCVVASNYRCSHLFTWWILFYSPLAW